MLLPPRTIGYLQRTIANVNKNEHPNQGRWLQHLQESTYMYSSLSLTMEEIRGAVVTKILSFHLPVSAFSIFIVSRSTLSPLYYERFSMLITLHRSFLSFSLGRFSHMQCVCLFNNIFLQLCT